MQWTEIKNTKSKSISPIKINSRVFFCQKLITDDEELGGELADGMLAFCFPADQLQLIKDLLSAPINTLVDDSSKIKEILEQIESQLPELLRVKLWPAGHLPFFRAEVKAAQQRIDLRHSQAPLKADIAQKCKLLNQKKATLDAKAEPRTQDDSTSWKRN